MFNINTVSNDMKDELKGLIDQNRHQEEITALLVDFSKTVTKKTLGKALRQIYFIEKFETIKEIESCIHHFEKVTSSSM